MRAYTTNFAFGRGAKTVGLSRFSLAIILVFGLTLLLIHLGDTRVLTRHEVLAAQPGREMLHDGTLRRWMLPMIGGVPREAKPPGMMWLIAMSIYIFRSEQEWVARLPSALAGLAVAIMIAKLAGRWFGNRLGRLAGLLQLTFVYTLTQAKLAEADMCLSAAVCAALCSLAIGVINCPAGVDNSRRNRVTFWLAMAAAFLLKGPIGPLFIALTAISFGAICRDRRVVKFVLDPLGIACGVIVMAVWPLVAWRLDPSIVHVWNSEAVGTASGQFGSDPIYYYLWSVPVMLLPWAPFVIVGLWRGPNAELAGPMVSQADRARLWRFLLCWFVPGILFLSLAMKMKHHHYPLPIFPALTIPAAMGLDYYLRRQSSRRQPLIWPIFLAACVVGAVVVFKLPQIAPAMKRPVIALIGIIAAGGLISLHFERSGRPGMMLAGYLMTAWIIGVGVQSWVMPAQDDFKYQADFARSVDGSVPPGKTIYLLGHREEEQEAEYIYYLRFPMQRLAGADELPTADALIYAIAPAGMVLEFAGRGDVRTLATCSGLRARETEADRLVLLRITQPSH